MKDLQYWLLDSDKRPLYINNSGLVSYVPTGIVKPDGYPAHLVHSPIRWKDELVLYSRNPAQFGMMRNYTVPVDFVGDGGKIVKDAKWRNGPDAMVHMAVKKLNKTVFPDRYDHWYTGEIDFSKASQSKDRISAMCVEGGLSKLLKANESTVYELPVNTDPERKILFMDGVPFRNNVRLSILEGSLFGTNVYPALGVTSNEGTTQGIVYQDTDTKVGVSLATSAESYFFKSVDKSVSLHITGKVIITSANNVIDYITVQKRNITDLTTVVTYYNIVATYTPSSYPDIIDVDITIPVEPGDHLYFEDRMLGGGGSFGELSNDSYLNLEYEVTFNRSFCECLTPKRVLTLLLDKIAPGYTFLSSFLDNIDIDGEIFLTSGQSLRKYQATSVIKTSWNDLKKSLKRWGIDYGIHNDVLVIEKYEYFFKSTVSMNIGEVTDWEIYDAEDLVYNSFKFGYPNTEVDKVNGRDEFNVTTRFSGPQKRQVKELDIVGEYHAGMYEIEVARIDLYGKDTTDSNVDNTVYMLNVKSGYTYEFYSGDVEFETSMQLKISKKISPLPIIGDIVTLTGFGANDGSYQLTGYLSSPGETKLSFGTATFTTGLGTGVISVSSPINYSLNRPLFDSISGLLHPAESFNILLRPKLSLLNNGRYLRSICDFNDFNSLEFTSGDRNSELETVLSGVTIKENSNEPIGGLGDQLFKPYYIKFKTKGSASFLDVMNSVDKYGLIEFSINGVTLTAFLWEGRANPATDEAQEWVMLMGPNNDLTKLINL